MFLGKQVLVWLVLTTEESVYTHEVHTTEQYLELLVRKGREGGRMDCARLSDERFLPWKTKHGLKHQKGYEASLLHASFQLLEFSFLT